MVVVQLAQGNELTCELKQILPNCQTTQKGGFKNHHKTHVFREHLIFFHYSYINVALNIWHILH